MVQGEGGVKSICRQVRRFRGSHRFGYHFDIISGWEYDSPGVCFLGLLDQEEVPVV